jgi:hypothetical protein
VKRWFFLFALVLCVAVPADTGAANRSEQWLIRTLDAEGARVEQVVFHHGSRSPVPLSASETAKLAAELGRAFAAEGMTVRSGSDGITWSASQSVQNGVQAGLTVIHDGMPEQRIRPYISIRLTVRGRPGPELDRLRLQCDRVLQSFGIIPRYHVTVQGSKPAGKDETRPVVSRLLEKLGAREVEAMRTDHTVSVSAYTSVLPDRLETAGGIMNVQVAARLNHDANRLVLTLGTPIITIEY